MSSLTIICYTHYLTRVKTDDGEDIAWRSDDYRASNFIKALKRKPFKGYAWFDNVKITEETSASADVIFARWAFELIDAAAAPDDVVSLVPMPSSGTVVGSTEDFCSLRLARAIAALAPRRVRVADVLRFKQAMTPSHQGGTRNPTVLARNMVATSRPSGGPLVLIDDVTTSNGHLKAAVRVLTTAGAPAPDIALCGGRSVQEPPADPFAHAPEDVECDEDW